MVQSQISLTVLKKVLIDSHPQRQQLLEIYGRLPQTRCRRQAYCCALLPEMTLLEGLQILKKMEEMSVSQRTNLTKGIIQYFFINPAKITSCPFLRDRECLIYPSRPFGCRAYGLWSENYYEGLFEQSRQAKSFSQQQWQKLGVDLPKEVIEFQVPYCKWVQSDSRFPVNDASLLKAWDDIDALSEVLISGDHLFKNRYLSDLSFLLAALTFDDPKVLRLKFWVVQDMVNMGCSERLSGLINQCFDLLGES
jgi:Fe-S-cluster containining protein